MDGRALTGGLTLTLTAAEGRVVDVALQSERPTAMGRALLGLDDEAAAARLPLLFGVCGMAQQVAGLMAMENATGRRAHPRARRCREIAVLAETVVETMRGITLGWSRFVGAGPDATGFLALSSARDVLLSGLSESAAWRRPAAPGADDAKPARITDGVVAMSEALAGMGLDTRFITALETGDVDAYRAWAEGGGGVMAETVARLFNGGWGDFSVAPFLPLVASRDSLSERLALDDAGAFQARPDVEGKPRETGALEAMAEQSLVRAVVAAREHGLLARVTARLADLADALDRMARLVARAEELTARVSVPYSGGAGVADIRCARGRLMHWVRMDAGQRIAAYRILAPTEWTFHPDGALVRGLRGQRGADRPDFEKHVALLVAAMDPCVSCDIVIREAAHA